MADLVAMDEITKAIQNQTPVGELRKMHSLTKIQKEWLRKRLKKADFSEKMRLHYYLGVLLDDENARAIIASSRTELTVPWIS